MDTDKRDIFGNLIPVSDVAGDLAVSTSTDALIAAIDATTRDMPSSGGLPFLTLDKGGNGWYFGQERIVADPNAETVANISTFQKGLCIWEDAKVREHMVSVAEPTPSARDLGPGNWQPQYSVELRFISGEDAGTTVLYKTSSDGGSKCMKGLLAAIRQRAAMLKDAATRDPSVNRRSVFPVIRLKSDFYMHPKYGRTHTPVLEIIRWIDPTEGLEAAQANSKPSATPAPAAAKQAPLAAAVGVEDVLPTPAASGQAGRRRRVGA